MLPCLIHIGQPKTGTTSIQSTLFWRLRDPRFRLVSLDTVFGNRVVQAAFLENPARTADVFLGPVTSHRLPAFVAESRHYLHDALEAAHRHGAVPVLSAETAWFFSETEFDSLRRFVVERGFQPRVICYLRPPLDLLASRFQQRVKVGRDPWDLVVERIDRFGAAAVIRRVDRVFGPQDVVLSLFDPDRFPGRCVVRHFCAVAGIKLDPRRIVRENESLNLDAVRFLHAFNLTTAGQARRRSAWVKRAVLTRVFKDLPGPPFALHASLQGDAARQVEPDLPWLRERLQEPFPLTLTGISADAGLRDESDLFDYSPEALDWLARKTGHRVAVGGSPTERVASVGRQVSRLVRRSPGACARVLYDTLAVRWHRRRLQARMLR